MITYSSHHFFKAFLGFWAIIFIISFSSCQKPKPQLPSNKETKEEIQPLVDLVRMNKELIEKEDHFLDLYVQENEPTLKKTDTGFWYKKEQTTQSRFLKKDDVCVINYQLYSLAGDLLEEVVDLQIIVGKKELITGLDQGLELMGVGESALFLFPWNLAYGMKGYKNLVPSYTSVIFKIKVQE